MISYESYLNKLDKRERIAAHNCCVKTDKINEIISLNKQLYPESDEAVLEFIGDFTYRGSPDVEVENSVKSIISLFKTKYSIYFATMLKTAFNRGTCLICDSKQVVWCDVNDTLYDIEGVYPVKVDACKPVVYEDYLEAIMSESSFKSAISKMGQAEDNISKRKKYTEELITAHMNAVPKASKQVLQFIADFMYHGTPDVIMEDSAESVRSTFRAGYCYYFAEMLKLAFDRGCVCWAAPFSHIVWCDTNGVAYDIEGVYFGEAEYLIPISYIEDSLWSFKHVPNVEGVIRDSAEIMKEYESDLKSGVLEAKGLGYVDYGYLQ